MKFGIKAGFRVTTPYQGVQLLKPENNCGCSCTAPLCFSWSPYKETTQYRFELSENSDMSSPLVATTVTGTTAYQYTGSVDCNTNYFWRVQASAPAPSEWSATFSFMTGPSPVSLPPPQQIETQTPLWVWLIIIITTLVLVCMLVLVIRSMR